MIDNQLLQQIEQAKREWEVTIDALPQLVCLLDTEGQIIRANRTVERWELGLVVDVYGRHFHHLLHPKCNDPDCYLQVLWERSRTELADGHGIEIEVEDPILQGHFQVQLEPILSQPTSRSAGPTSFASLSIHDITKQKQNEARLQQLINQATLMRHIEAELTHSLDIDETLKIALRAVLNVSGADSGCIGLIDKDGRRDKLHTIGSPEGLESDLQPPSSTLMRVIQQKKAELVKLYVAADGPIESLTQFILPLMSRDRVMGFVALETLLSSQFTPEMLEFIQSLGTRIASAIDNAQLYHIAQGQLKDMQILYREVSALEQIKTEVIRLAAHDLRNPLGSILLTTDMLSRAVANGASSEKQHELISRIKHSATAMKNIASDILSLERVEQLRKNDLQNIHLDTVVKAAFEEFRAQAKDKSLDYELKLPVNQLVVKGDMTMLHESVVNLISNAIKYTPEGGRIQVRLLTKDPALAVFEVEDNGYGIPEEQQAKIFQPFFRAKSKDTLEISGTGLGLHLIKNIIERCGGKIYFRSVVGHGSTFSFALPLIAEPIQTHS